MFGFILLCVLVAVIIFMLVVMTSSGLKNEKETAQSKPIIPPKPVRIYVKDVKVGEHIQIEWYRIKGGIGQVKCLNNDPETKKILLQVQWGNYKETGALEYEKMILDYSDDKLKNFHLLNTLDISSPQSKDDDKEDYDIAKLQKQMNDALAKEDYRYADEIQKKIDKLLKK